MPTTYIESSISSNTQSPTALLTPSSSYTIPNTYVNTPTSTSVSDYPISTTYANSFINNLIEPFNTKMAPSDNYVTPIDVYLGNY